MKSSQPQRGAIDRTEAAARRQFAAMGCNLFEIGVRHEHTGRMLQRSCTSAQLHSFLPWLKHCNAEANHIYIRAHQQAEPHGLVLVDDLCQHALNKLMLDGLAPAVVVETSPGNHQAWLHFSPPPDDQARTILARILAERYDGDINSAHCRHYGRLAGFTNPKPRHIKALGAPWTLLRVCTGHAVSKGEPLLREARRRAQTQRPRRHRLPVPLEDKNLRSDNPASRIYRYQFFRLHQRYGDQIDCSRVDWAAACALARAGYSPAVIENVILQLSPALSIRKKGHEYDYVARTAAKAFGVVAGSHSTLRLSLPFSPPALPGPQGGLWGV